MKTVTSIASVLAAFALSAVSVKAQLVNGDFNTGDLSGWWTYVPDAPTSSITVTNDVGFAFDSSPYLYMMARNPSAFDMGQSVSAAAGTQYEISLAYRANNWGGAGVGVHYLDSSWSQVGWEWTSLYTGDGNDTGWNSFTTPTWTAPANTAYIEVRLNAWEWSDTYVDNVSLNVIPEPGVGALLGLGGLLMIRRRNARARR
jgi:hypothetical protein